MSRISAGLQVLALVAGAAATGVEAQGLVTTHKLSAALANQLVGDSVAACAQKGYQVVAVVVDLDGVRQAVLRGDGAPIHSMDNAYKIGEHTSELQSRFDLVCRLLLE